MAFDLKEFLVSAILPMIKVVGKSQLSHLLAQGKEHNTSEVYENTLKSIHSSFSLLAELAAKSKTKVDDDIIGLVLEAVEEAAAADGITL